MAGNHGFIDGNKRTTLIILDLLIERSSYEWAGVPLKMLNLEVENIILRAAAGNLDFDETVRWFNARLRRK